MRFEEHELKPYATFVPASELREGVVYFSLQYLDEEMLVPVLQPVVFIGRNLEPTDVGQAYFQDAASFWRGFRYNSSGTDDDAVFESYPETKTGDVGAIFEYDHALDELMRCALRRRNRFGLSLG